MKKQILLPFVLLGSLGMVASLAACQPKEAKPEEGYGVAISNKDELLETWYAGTSRAIEIDLTPAGNVMQEFTTGALTIESSNTEVVSITGANANALAEGQATVTVKYHGWKDSVDLTISHKQTIQEKYGVAHAGTSEDPLTNEEAIAITNHEAYADGQEDLYVGGVVSSFYHAPGSRTDGAVSWFLTPAEGQTEKFEIYKCYKEGTGAASYLGETEVWKGGYAVAHGRFTKYGDQCETSAAIFDRCEGTAPSPRTTVETTFAAALEAGKALEDGDSSWDWYKFDAYVTKQEGSNYFLTATKAEAITDVKTNTIEIYGASTEVAAKLLKNAKVTVKMILKNYHSQVENGLALTVDDVTVIEQGSAWVIPEHNVTVAQGLEVINGLADGATTEDLYIFTEVYVKAVTGAYNAQYGNMNFTIADTADGTDTITVFRAKTDATTAAKVVAGAQVTIKGNLQKYVSNGNTTPELLNVASITVKESGEGGGGEGGGGEQVNPLTAPLAIDFSSLASGSEFNATTGLAALKAGASTENAALITEVSAVSKVYAGNGSGGAHNGEAGMIKFGTSSANGTITIVFGAKFNKVELNCHDFYAVSEAYPTNSNKFSVNGGTEVLAPYNATGAWEVLTFDNLQETNTLTITCNKRGTVRGITLSYVAE
ncbi:MAG: hypothetical protein J5511_04495 [Bacilli bacterium]|nr:hypothetical protein [Bacilli bacterium]